MATITTLQRKSNGLAGIFSRPFRQMDYGLLVATVALTGIGLMMVYSSSLFVSLYYQNTVNYYFQRQLVAALLGLAMIFGLQFVDYRFYRRYSTWVMLGTLALLFVVLVLGDTLLGARRGLSGGSYQPSELAKLITIVYIANWLSSKGERIKDFGLGLLPFVFLVGIVGGLIAIQPDLSTAVLIALVAFTMFFVAGGRWLHFFAMLAVGVLVFFILINIFSHAATRWNDYVLMLKDPTQAGWHIKQVFFGFARGGISGQGLGNSFQKTGPLPVPHTDSILAVIGEELGLAGSLTVLGLLVFIAYRGFRIMLDTKESFGRMLALGITTWITYQGLLNAAVMTGVVPFTGLPFPFVSYGGSSMLISLMGIGVLLNISQQNHKDAAGLRPISSKRSKRASVSVSGRDRRSYSSRFVYRR